jgi:BolA protein
MEIMDQIAVLLRNHIAPEHLQIINESHKHAGHMEAGEGGDTHFRIKIAGGALAGQSRVAQHRMIYAALSELMNNPIHALAIEIEQS